MTMSGQAEMLPIELPASPKRAARIWTAIESLLERAGDYLNPILVKEARQALKSKQFVITFGLLLLFCWASTFICMAAIGPELSFGFHGSTLFIWYYVFLSAAMLVVVPFSAFRSLASEQEDRTYELLSITALSPRQIISGKLASAFLQMLIYLSAASPCLAFTYLLRGIDFPTILFVLFWLTAASLGFSMLGLLLGTLTEHKYFQVLLSVAVIVGLIVGFICGCFIVAEGIVGFGMSFNWPEFWPVMAMFLTAYLTYFAVVFLAATARISFASENRSTPIRIAMTVQHLALFGWTGWVFFHFEFRDIAALLAPMILLGLHWFVAGSFMTGESAELSLRVQRRLPQSFLGRIFFTWYQPGPGTGYMFAVASILGGLFVLLAGCTICDRAYTVPGVSYIEHTVLFGVLGASYLIIYLGLNLLVMRLIRRYARVDLVAAPLVQVILIVVGCVVPAIIQEMTPGWRSQGYSLLQAPNFVWTLEAVLYPNWATGDTAALIVLLPVMALVVFILNLPGIAREVRYVRIAKPKRVAEDDAAHLPPPPTPLPESPWDEE